MSGKRILATLLIVASLGVTGGAVAAPSDERGILPLDQYTSEKGRRLAMAHEKALRALSAGIYDCMPWVETTKQSIGFFRPKHIARDDRYLSVRIYIEQDPSPKFAAMRIEDQGSAMFSRYVGPLLRRMTADPTMLRDARMDGFTIILEWLKQAPTTATDRPIHETIAIFLDKSSAADFLASRISIGELASRAHVLGFDGEAALGTLTLTAWHDNFVNTYKVANYEPDNPAACR